MAFFKKKKEKKNQSVPQKERNPLEIMNEIEGMLGILEEAEGNKRIESLNNLGSLYFEANEIDKSIEYYETSISESNTLGKAFTDLIKLYNLKQKDAIAEKDDAKLQTYLEKTDQLMKLTKDTIRGRV